MKCVRLVGARGGLGDLVLFSSVLKSFRQMYPDDKIICGTSLGCLELAKSIPYFDDYIPDFRPRYLRNDRGRCWYRNRRTGFSLPKIDQYYSLNHPYKNLSEEENKTVHIIDLCARILGVTEYERKGKVFLKEEHFKNAGVSRIRRPILVVAPVCSQEKKTPDFGLFARIVEAFEMAGYTCFKLLPPGMGIEEIACSTVSFPSILEAAAFISQADFFVGLDAGVSHIAASLDVPVSTIHIGYTLERSGVLGSRVNPMYFPSRDIDKKEWIRIVRDICSYAASCR